MKSFNVKQKENAKPKNDAKLTNGPRYYFHPDEDFKVDWDWGKDKTIASKAISRPANQFEI
jgi:hypothetical protein